MNDKKSIGLWKSQKQDKNGNYYYSGKLPSGEWINLYKNKSDNPKAPALNLVLPDGFEITRHIEGTFDDVVNYQKQGAIDEDIPF